MKKLIFFLFFLAISGCNNPKTVLICGDHVCINKDEAEQYFEENLVLEVRVLDKNSKNNVDLVELNLRSSAEGDKEIIILNKEETRNEIKILSNDEIAKKKIELKEKKKNKVKKNNQNIISKKPKIKKIKKKEKSQKNIKKTKKIVNKSEEKITDICTILEKCSIDEISRYLVKQGKNKKFPDITIRENK
tara:strand:+ start:287 stop:856 length:570 start_codon:yes stop_codon:yes gene_type:complete